jgi:hypothetical protein
MIDLLSGNPDSPVPGWCNESRGNMADEMAMTRRAIIGIVQLLERFGLVERNERDHLRTTLKWKKAVETARAAVNGCEKTSHQSPTNSVGCEKTSQGAAPGCENFSHQEGEGCEVSSQGMPERCENFSHQEGETAPEGVKKLHPPCEKTSHNNKTRKEEEKDRSDRPTDAHTHEEDFSENFSDDEPEWRKAERERIERNAAEFKSQQEAPSPEPEGTRDSIRAMLLTSEQVANAWRNLGRERPPLESVVDQFLAVRADTKQQLPGGPWADATDCRNHCRNWIPKAPLNSKPRTDGNQTQKSSSGGFRPARRSGRTSLLGK